MKPVPPVCTDFLSSLQFYNISLPLTKETTHKVIVVNLSQKANTLTVTATGSRQSCIAGNVPYFLFHQSTKGEHQFGDLQIINLRKKIGLILYWIDSCAQPYLTIFMDRSGIMTSSSKIKLFAYLLFKATELNEAVTHHIRIRSQSTTNFINGISSNLFPIFFLQIYHFQRQSVTMCNSRSHLPIFFSRTIHIIGAVHSYLNIKQRRPIPLLTKKVYDN